MDSSVNIGGYIEKVNGKELSYSDFVKRYMEKNKPVVLTGLMDEWRACSDWVIGGGEPNLHYFSSHFGNSRVQVADCGRREFTDQKRVEMSVSDFISNWLELSGKKCTYASGNGQTLLYLKDWHFVKEHPDYAPYTTPLFFRDDWLNIYLDSHHMHRDPDTYHETNDINCSDYRFVYMGTKGTWTPLHADVFRSYSWSANVCGKKKWLFLSPSQCHLVFDSNLKSSVYDIFGDVLDAKFPDFKKAIWLECTQEQNEIIFVPSGWYHQVHNLEDTISINHNWFNAYNLSWVWELLVKDYREAREYIEDIRDICDDFEGLCQRNLAANTGMNYSDFFIFIVRLSFANLIQLYHLIRCYQNCADGLSARVQYLVSNIVSMRKVSVEMESIGGFRGHIATSLDLKEVLEEPEFLDLCRALHRTYEIIDNQVERSPETNEPFRVDLEDLDFFEASNTKVSTPRDLIRGLDYAFMKFNGISDFGSLSLISSDDN
ncbi:2-oxoglutarate and iron-dependent oxygenase JMJD4 [Macadamia integrifolia]|uniref:2-oxoglutarate and iron-dependent oxygenase JMJD4 n=1 Tax=Macadamia integrifolia TaxID=60698 RepID=UPI001C4FB816|nr:2-oxoglutarate and iron-dependent oxygenase JMJD4 [Macadamia integrifolia]